MADDKKTSTEGTTKAGSAGDKEVATSSDQNSTDSGSDSEPTTDQEPANTTDDVEYTFGNFRGTTTGAVTGNTYAYAPGKQITAPEGEFDHLPVGRVASPIPDSRLPFSLGDHSSGGMYKVLKGGQDTGETVGKGKEEAQKAVDELNERWRDQREKELQQGVAQANRERQAQSTGVTGVGVAGAVN